MRPEPDEQSNRRWNRPSSNKEKNFNHGLVFRKLTARPCIPGLEGKTLERYTDEDGCFFNFHLPTIYIEDIGYDEYGQRVSLKYGHGCIGEQEACFQPGEMVI